MGLYFTLSVQLSKVCNRADSALDRLIGCFCRSRQFIIGANASHVMVCSLSDFSGLESLKLGWFIQILELSQVADLGYEIVNAFKLFFFWLVWMMWMWIWLVPIIASGSLCISVTADIAVSACSFTIRDADIVMRRDGGVLSENAFVMLRLEVTGSCLVAALVKVLLSLWGSSKSLLDELLLLHVDRGHSSTRAKRKSSLHFE